MSMPGQHQIDAKLGNPIEHVGEISMAQKNVDRFRHHQLFNLPQLPVDVTSPLRLSSAMWLVYADQIQRLAPQHNGRTCLAQDVDAGKLGDTKTVEGFGQARQGDTWSNDFHI